MPGTRRESLSLALTGSGGTGMISAGELLLRACARIGLYGLQTRSVGPQIRGGESAALLRIAHYPVEAHDDAFHVLFAADWQNFERFAGEITLADDVVVITDEAATDIPRVVRAHAADIRHLPLHAIAREHKARINMVGLGLLGHLLRLTEEELADIIHWFFTRKGRQQFIEPSIAAMRAGFALAEPMLEEVPSLRTTPDAARAQAKAGRRWLISGNQAVATGFLQAGGRFVAGYPITPATDMLEWLAARLPQLGGQLVQAEDELAAINMVLGASYGGIPAMTATSGPGFSLMAEGIGLGVMAEIPALIVDVQRIGPSTGIPTKSEQGDLQLALCGTHGDAPHLVIAPDCINDAIRTTAWALHLAEKLQCPAVLLSDQKLGQMLSVIDAPEGMPPWKAERETVAACETGDYRRFALTDSGISPVALPGAKGCMHTIDGLEHDEAALPSSKVEDHAAQLEKRWRKLQQMEEWPEEEMRHWADCIGTGEVCIITFGSSAGPAREAIRLAADMGLHARHISMRLLFPPQKKRLHKLLEGVKRLIVVEQTHSGQFLHYLKAHYELPEVVISCRRPGPKPITPQQVLRALREACTVDAKLTERVCT